MNRVLLIVLFCASIPAPAAPVIGDRMPAFALNDAGGHTVSWSPGRTSVIWFCAFWCDTWRDQTQRVTAAEKALKGLPVDFLTISADGRWSDIPKGSIAGKLLLDPERTLARKLGVNRIPYVLVVDPGGAVVHASHGTTRASAIISAVRGCLSDEEAQKGGVIYLTFDDFPSPESQATTPAGAPDDRLLRVLSQNQVPATFFCVCNRLKGSRDLVDRALRDGHALQVHCWDHQDKDPHLPQCVREIKRITGLQSTLHRPAGSDRCSVIGGSPIPLPVVNPYDYTRPGVVELKRRILLAAKPGSVILLHAGVSETVEALPSVISHLRRRGLTFRCLP